MNINFYEFYTEPGFSYNFSAEFDKWILRELGKRIEPTKVFGRKYPGYTLSFSWDASSKISEPRIAGPTSYPRDKEVVFSIKLPHHGRRSTNASGYARAFKQMLGSVVEVVKKLALDETRLVDDSPELIQHFVSRPKMIAPDDDWDTPEVPEKPTAKPAPPPPDEITPPEWKMPKNLKKLIAADGEDGMWEDDGWEPIKLTVMAGTSYNRRDIPLAWQIEFEPGDRAFKAANAEISSLGFEPDGYCWSTVIERVVNRRHRNIAGKLHFGDTETETCVVWVESEAICKTLIETVWLLIHKKGQILRYLSRRKKDQS